MDTQLKAIAASASETEIANAIIQRSAASGRDGSRSRRWTIKVNPTSSTMGSFGSTPSAITTTTKQRRGTGVECPNEECGSMHTPVRLSGKDQDARPIRKRRCEDCGTVFVTCEVVVVTNRGNHRLVRFSEVDDTHQRAVTSAKRKRFGWKAKPSKRQPIRIYGGLYINR